MAERIAADGVDILVDLTGHLEGNRLLAFARKPAPIQVTYIGYQNTTGMVAMDYRLTDAWSDPPGMTELLHTERLVRLPRAFFCYQPSDEAPEVNELPALAAGRVTFGSFNKLAKVTREVLTTWGRILASVPDSRLLMLADPSGEALRRMREAFGRQGVSPERVEFVAKRPRAGYLRLHHEVDIALDAFPFNGHTTVCEALWMGVPVVMLAGATYVTRFGGTALLNLELEDLIATTEVQYIEVATRLATDLGRLRELRGHLRQRMLASPLLDAVGFTRHLEAVYRPLWKHRPRSDSMNEPMRREIRFERERRMMLSVAEAMALGTRHHQAGQLAEAERIYRQVLAVEPDNAHALHYLGVLALQARQFAAAVDLIGRAIRVDRMQAAFHANLGEAHRHLAAFSEAVKCFQTALKLAPDVAQLHTMLAGALAAQGEWTEAAAALREALRLKPEDVPSGRNWEMCFWTWVKRQTPRPAFAASCAMTLKMPCRTCNWRVPCTRKANGPKPSLVIARRWQSIRIWPTRTITWAQFSSNRGTSTRRSAISKRPCDSSRVMRPPSRTWAWHTMASTAAMRRPIAIARLPRPILVRCPPSTIWRNATASRPTRRCAHLV